MSITTLFNSDKNSLLKELIVEDVYEEKDLKQKTDPVEIMKHIYPTRHAPKRSEVPNFAQLPRVLFQAEKKHHRADMIESSRNFKNAPSESLSLPEK